jgi:hypothetical protein
VRSPPCLFLLSPSLSVKSGSFAKHHVQGVLYLLMNAFGIPINIPLMFVCFGLGRVLEHGLKMFDTSPSLGKKS